MVSLVPPRAARHAALLAVDGAQPARGALRHRLGARAALPEDVQLSPKLDEAVVLGEPAWAQSLRSATLAQRHLVLRLIAVTHKIGARLSGPRFPLRLERPHARAQLARECARSGVGCRRGVERAGRSAAAPARPPRELLAQARRLLRCRLLLFHRCVQFPLALREAALQVFHASLQFLLRLPRLARAAATAAAAGGHDAARGAIERAAPGLQRRILRRRAARHVTMEM